MRKGLHTPARKSGCKELQGVLAQGKLPGPAPNQKGGTFGMNRNKERLLELSRIKKRVLLAACIIGILLISGCTYNRSVNSLAEEFCFEQGYDGYDYLESADWTYGWCYNIENDTMIQRRYVNHDNGSIYFDEDAHPCPEYQEPDDDVIIFPEQTFTTNPKWIENCCWKGEEPGILICMIDIDPMAWAVAEHELGKKDIYLCSQTPRYIEVMPDE